jgi:hypothetical protein
MAPDPKARRKNGAIANTESGADDRSLTAGGARRLATKLGFSDQARDVLVRCVRQRSSTDLTWVLPDADAKRLAQEIGISRRALDLYCRWLRLEMSIHHMMEKDRREPSDEDIREALPQIARQLACFEQIVRRRYRQYMEIQEVWTLPKNLQGDEADKAIAAARQSVREDLRGFGAVVARLKGMTRSGLFQTVRRSRRTKRRAHDHTLAERALTFWARYLRDQGVRQDQFCGLVLGLAGIPTGSIDTFVRVAREALRTRKAPQGPEAFLAARLPDLYGLADEVLSQYLAENGLPEVK